MKPRYARPEDWEFLARSGQFEPESRVGRALRDIVLHGRNKKRPFPHPTHCLVYPGQAFLAFTTDPRDPDPATAPLNICKAYTDPAHRRRGLASALVRKVLRLSCKTGRPGVQAMAEAASLGFWERIGFKARGELEGCTLVLRETFSLRMPSAFGDCNINVM